MDRETLKRKKKKIGIIIATAIIIVVALSFTFNTLMKPMQKPKKEYTLSLGMYMKPTTWDPVKHFIEHVTEVQRHVYQPLVRFGEGMQPEPALAKNWIYKNDTTWVFYLREGVKFHNGENFTAEDAVFSIRRGMGEGEVESRITDTFSSIKSVKKLDKYKIEIKTEELNPTLPNEISQILIVPKSYVKENGPSILEEKPIGTGPYKVKALKNKSTVLTAFEDYWGSQPSAEKLVLKYYGESLTKQTQALLQGEINATEIKRSMYDQVQGKENLEVKTAPSLSVDYLALDNREETYAPHISLPEKNNTNTSSKLEENPFSKVKVRKAVDLTIDQQEIIKNIHHGHARPATQYISPRINGFNSKIKRQKPDPEKAKELMEEAGYSEGFNFTLTMCGKGPQDKKLAKEIKENLEKININAKPEYITLGDCVKEGTAGNLTAYQIGWTAETGDAMSPFSGIIHSQTEKYGTYNLNHYHNEEVDELIEEAKVETDSKERTKKIHKTIEISMEERAVIPLWVDELTYGIEKNLEWKPNSYGKLYGFEIKIPK